MGEGLTDLLDLSRADITTKRPERRKRGLRQISDLAARISRLAAEDATQAPLPKGLGTLIMKHFSIPPSRTIGDIKKRLEQEVETGNLQPQQPSEYYVGWLEKHRDEVGF